MQNDESMILANLSLSKEKIDGMMTLIFCILIQIQLSKLRME